MIDNPPNEGTQPQGGPLYRMVVLSVLAVVIGLLVSMAAIGFVEAVLWLNQRLLISPRTRVLYEGWPLLVMLATVTIPALGGLIVGFLLWRVPEQGRVLGPANVIRSVQLREPLQAGTHGVQSTIASVVSLGFGASVGQYGPLVYLGAQLGNLSSRLKLRVYNIQSIAIACGVAAAISTAFNAPIAGLVFAHEVILRHYSMQAFAPTTVASATGYVVANVLFERPSLFLVAFPGVQHSYEFLLFALLGILAAGVAIVFMRLVLRMAAIAAASRFPTWLRPGMAGLAVGLTALWLPDVLGIGVEALRFATIEGAFGGGELALLVVAKLVLTALCIGFGFAGGVFSPSLLIGVLFGALCWTVLTMLGMVSTSGIEVYAICAMMAVSSAVIGAPLTTILIVFELTRNYDLTIAAMVAVVFSNLVTYRLFGRSLFDVQLARAGVDLSSGRERARLSVRLVRTYARDDFPRAMPDEPAASALSRLRGSEWGESFVVDEADTLVGLLRPPLLIEDEDASARDRAEDPQLVFTTSTTVWEAMQRLEDFIGDAIPVVEPDAGRLVGVVTEADLIRAFLAEERELRRERHASV